MIVGIDLGTTNSLVGGIPGWPGQADSQCFLVNI